MVSPMVTETFIAEEKIIVNEKYLSPEILSGFPQGRERQIEQLQVCLKPILRGQVPLNAWLYGPPGSGKTQITRYLVEKYCANTNSLAGVYVNCWHRRSMHSVLQEINGQLKILETEVQDTHLKFTRLRQALQDKTTIIILDEIDRPIPSERNAIIYQILQLPRTGLICISGNHTAYSELDNRVKSRLFPLPIYMPRYTVAKTKAILAERAQNALLPESYTETIILKISSLAGGDMRKAISLLRQAALAAETAGDRQITDRHISTNISLWQNLEKDAKVKALSQHQRLLLKIVRKYKKISSSELCRRYLLRCKKQSIEPVARRTYSRYLQFLARGDFIHIDSSKTGGPGRLIIFNRDAYGMSPQAVNNQR